MSLLSLGSKKQSGNTANIALLLQTECPVVGVEPSPEDLALLAEGKLSTERREEVLGHLAANPELYHQWLSLVELSQATKTLESVVRPVVLTSPSLVAQLRAVSSRFFDGLLQPQMLAATAILLIVGVVFLSPLYPINSSANNSVTLLYQRWQPQLAEGQTDIVMRGRVGVESGATTPITEDGVALYMGIRDGLTSLGRWAYIDGLLVNPEIARDRNLQRNKPSFYQLGQLVALASQACRQSTLPADMAQQLAASYRATLKELPSLVITDDYVSEVQMVCALTNRILREYNVVSK